jgi:hypothetical protein
MASEAGLIVLTIAVCFVWINVWFQEYRFL